MGIAKLLGSWADSRKRRGPEASPGRGDVGILCFGLLRVHIDPTGGGAAFAVADGVGEVVLGVLVGDRGVVNVGGVFGDFRTR